MVSTTKSASFSVLAAACFVGQCQPYMPSVSSHRQKYVLAAASSTPSIVDAATERHFRSRRSFLTYSFAASFGVRPDAVIAADGKLNAILGQIKQGRDQLDSVPDLIKAEKWDAGKYHIES